MPISIETQFPFGGIRPYPKPRPTRYKEQASFMDNMKKKILKSDVEKRQSEYDLATANYEAGKISDNDFLTTVQDLNNRAYSAGEKNKYEILYLTNQSNIVKNKLDTEFKKVQKKIVDESISPKEAYNEITQLGVQAASAGLQNESAYYFLQASVMMNRMISKGDGLSDDEEDALFNSYLDLLE